MKTTFATQQDSVEGKLTASTFNSTSFPMNNKLFSHNSNDSHHICKNSTPPPKLRIIISGAPCSGKGTQCFLLKEKYNLIHISSGDLLRDNCKENSTQGNELRQYLNKGQLVPDELITEIIKKRLSQIDCKTKGWILDGFPRTINQAKELKQANIIPTHIFLLEAPKELLLRRSINRRLDPISGKIYNIITSPPDNDEIKGRLIQRHDDTREVMEKRIDRYNCENKALRDWYINELITLDGTSNPKKIFNDICNILQ